MYDYWNEDYIEHHGIKGQQWGVKHGPPYPLSKPMSNKIKKYKTIASSSRSEQEKETVKALEKIAKREWLNKKAYEGFEPEKAMLDKYLKYKIKRVEESSRDDSGYYRIQGPHSMEQDSANTNPGWDLKYIQTTNNCLLSSVAYNMRRRGYDVIARQKAPVDLLYDIDPEDLSIVFPKMTIKTANNLEDLNSKLINEPVGSRGILTMSWTEGTGGHAIAYERDKDGVKYVDAQVGKVLDKCYRGGINFRYARLDNQEVDFNALGLVVE